MMRSLRTYFKQENEMHERERAQHNIEDAALIEREFMEAKAVSNAWNAESAALRELRLHKERIEREDSILYELDKKREKDEAARKLTDELVRKEMVRNIHL